MEMIKCSACGKEKIKKTANHKYCSDKCKRVLKKGKQNGTKTKSDKVFCIQCKSADVIYSWPWADGTIRMPMCVACIPDFETYYKLMFNVTNLTLKNLGEKPMTVEVFRECFPVQKKIHCICEKVKSSICSSPDCKNKKGKQNGTKLKSSTR